MNRFELVAQPSPAAPTPPRRSLRILVVEDHADIRRGLEVMLDLLGHQAFFAGDMQTALQLASASRFDLLLSDLGLPDGTGWELLHRLEAMGRRPAYAVAISGFSGCADMERSREAGFQTHLVKPFTPETLEAVLKAVALELAAVQVLIA